MITNAATEAENVVGLVYVAAFAPEEGEALGAAKAASKDASWAVRLFPSNIRRRSGEPAVEFTLDPAKPTTPLRPTFPKSRPAVVGATQRPVAELAFSEPSGPPAWKELPSWAIIPLSTKQPAPMSFVRWRTGPVPPSPRSTAPTSS